jgi:3-carboxy-cis,cis-muconate cycloisomerase
VVLQLRDALRILERRQADMDAALVELARAHRDTIMPGRTHGQHALPITFGYKVAIWVDELRRHAARMRDCAPRVLVGQFGGAAGTLAGVGAHGLEIRAGMMARLGLAEAPITWHVAHDGFAEFASVAAMIAGTCGKIAHEVILLQKSEVMEVEEPWNEGKVGSSTMPHKRNPMLCEAIVALARLAFNQARASFDGLIQEHERDWTVNHMEWAYLPELCVMTDGALAQTLRVVRGMRVYPERMRRNVDALGGLMLSEAVMFALGERIGRVSAHDVVYDAAMCAVESGRAFADLLAADERVSAHLSRAEIAALLEPTRYTGQCGAFVDLVVMQYPAS